MVVIDKEGIYLTHFYAQKIKFIELDNRKVYHFTIRIMSNYALIDLNYITIKISEIEKLPLVLDTISELWKLRFKSSNTISNNKEVMTYVSIKNNKQKSKKRMKGKQNQSDFKYRKTLHSKKNQQKVNQFNNQKGQGSLKRNNNYRRN
ncbi:MAG: hypothetical protein AB8G11_23745 [Saprospiraceae bacterium]